MALIIMGGLCGITGIICRSINLDGEGQRRHSIEMKEMTALHESEKRDQAHNFAMTAGLND